MTHHSHDVREDESEEDDEGHDETGGSHQSSVEVSPQRLREGFYAGLIQME